MYAFLFWISLICGYIWQHISNSIYVDGWEGNNRMAVRIRSWRGRRSLQEQFLLDILISKTGESHNIYKTDLWSSLHRLPGSSHFSSPQSVAAQVKHRHGQLAWARPESGQPGQPQEIVLHPSTFSSLSYVYRHLGWVLSNIIFLVFRVWWDRDGLPFVL